MLFIAKTESSLIPPKSGHLDLRLMRSRWKAAKFFLRLLLLAQGALQSAELATQ